MTERIFKAMLSRLLSGEYNVKDLWEMLGWNE